MNEYFILKSVFNLFYMGLGLGWVGLGLGLGWPKPSEFSHIFGKKYFYLIVFHKMDSNLSCEFYNENNFDYNN